MKVTRLTIGMAAARCATRASLGSVCRALGRRPALLLLHIQSAPHHRGGVVLWSLANRTRACALNELHAHDALRPVDKAHEQANGGRLSSTARSMVVLGLRHAEWRVSTL